MPGHGVYAAWAHGHPARSTSGVRPTFQTGRGLLVEAYLIDFDGDLYGETLRVAFLKRLRGEKRFESVEALVEQMDRDVGGGEADRRGAARHFLTPARLDSAGGPVGLGWRPVAMVRRARRWWSSARLVVVLARWPGTSG